MRLELEGRDILGIWIFGAVVGVVLYHIIGTYFL